MGAFSSRGFRQTSYFSSDARAGYLSCYKTWRSVVIQFIKDNWKNAIFCGVVALVINNLWDIASPYIRSLDWEGAALVFKRSDAQAALLMVVAPALGATFYIKKYKQNKPEPLFKIIFGLMAAGYFAVFLLNMLFGDIQPLLDDMKKDPVSKVVLFVFVIGYALSSCVRIMHTGDGNERRH
jgi:hypothetical protein